MRLSGLVARDFPPWQPGRSGIHKPNLSKRCPVDESILTGKLILTVDDEPDVLEILKEEITAACGRCHIHQATTFEIAQEYLLSYTYDLVTLDIMGVRGFELLKKAVIRGFPVAMVTAHALTPEALKRSIEMGARAYLPKEKLGEIVPYLEDVLRYESSPGWKRLFEKLGGFFTNRFGSDWQKSDQVFWKDFNQKMETNSWAVFPKS
jgi:DNA-binding response OmpR family regulator